MPFHNAVRKLEPIDGICTVRSVEKPRKPLQKIDFLGREKRKGGGKKLTTFVIRTVLLSLIAISSREKKIF